MINKAILALILAAVGLSSTMTVLAAGTSPVAQETATPEPTREPSDSPIIITEIHYNASQEQGTEENFEFIELYNPSELDVDMTGYTFTKGIKVNFPSGLTIGAGEYLVLAHTAATYAEQGFPLLQWTSGKLDNGGEKLELVDSAGKLVLLVDYSDAAPWPVEPDGGGPSLSLIDVSLDGSLPESWQASAILGGTPGRPNDATDVVPVIIPKATTTATAEAATPTAEPNPTAAPTATPTPTDTPEPTPTAVPTVPPPDAQPTTPVAERSSGGLCGGLGLILPILAIGAVRKRRWHVA